MQILIYYTGLNHFAILSNVAVGPCPIHNGCGNAEFRAHLETETWVCNTCGCGDVIDFVKRKENAGRREALAIIEKILIQ